MDSLMRMNWNVIDPNDFRLILDISVERNVICKIWNFFYETRKFLKEITISCVLLSI